VGPEDAELADDVSTFGSVTVWEVAGAIRSEVPLRCAVGFCGGCKGPNPPRIVVLGSACQPAVLTGVAEVLAKGRNGGESSSSSSSSRLESLRIWRILLIAEGRRRADARLNRREDKGDAAAASASESEPSEDFCRAGLAN
jgi:hypothetical protein